MSYNEFDYKYNFDPSGISPENRVPKEVHKVEPGKSRFFIVREGPYYVESMIVRSSVDNKVLIPEVDYHNDFLYKAATQETGKEVASVIHLNNVGYVGEFYLDYQLVGGPYSSNVHALSNVVDTLMKDRKVVFWDDILNLPDLWDPSHHVHKGRDLTGLKEIAKGIDELKVLVQSQHDNKLENLQEEIDAKVSKLGPHKVNIDNSMIHIKNHVGPIRLKLPRSTENARRFGLRIAMFNKDTLIGYEHSGLETDVGVTHAIHGWIGNDHSKVVSCTFYQPDDRDNYLLFGTGSTVWTDMVVALRDVLTADNNPEHWVGGFEWQLSIPGNLPVVTRPLDFGMAPHTHHADDVNRGVLHPDRLPRASYETHGAVVVTDNPDENTQSKVPTSVAMKIVKDIADSKWLMVAATPTIEGIARLSNNFNGDSQVMPVTEYGVRNGLLTKSEAVHSHSVSDIISGVFPTRFLPVASLTTPGIFQLTNNWRLNATHLAPTSKALKDGLDTKSDAGHTHDASEVVSGIFDRDRLPTGDVDDTGIVQLTNEWDGDSQTLAVTQLGAKNLDIALNTEFEELRVEIDEVLEELTKAPQRYVQSQLVLKRQLHGRYVKNWVAWYDLNISTNPVKPWIAITAALRIDSVNLDVDLINRVLGPTMGAIYIAGIERSAAATNDSTAAFATITDENGLAHVGETQYDNNDSASAWTLRSGLSHGSHLYWPLYFIFPEYTVHCAMNEGMYPSESNRITIPAHSVNIFSGIEAAYDSGSWVTETQYVGSISIRCGISPYIPTDDQYGYFEVITAGGAKLTLSNVKSGASHNGGSGAYITVPLLTYVIDIEPDPTADNGFNYIPTVVNAGLKGNPKLYPVTIPKPYKQPGEWIYVETINDWSPSTDTVNEGTAFTQTATIREKRYVYPKWTYRDRPITRPATGTKSTWVKTGEKTVTTDRVLYDPWGPDTGTVLVGNNFTQTRGTSTEWKYVEIWTRESTGATEERASAKATYWVHGSETRIVAGTKPDVITSWEYSHMNVDWNPAASSGYIGHNVTQNGVEAWKRYVNGVVEWNHVPVSRLVSGTADPWLAGARETTATGVYVGRGDWTPLESSVNKGNRFTQTSDVRYRDITAIRWTNQVTGATKYTDYESTFYTVRESRPAIGTYVAPEP